MKNDRGIIIRNFYTNPPEWAVLERYLINLMNNSIELVNKKYLKEDGSLMWPPDFEDSEYNYSWTYISLDDAYESFHNWPLFYVLGGSKRLLEISERQYDVITKTFSKYSFGHKNPLIVNEFDQGADWFHLSEGYQLFYFLCLADPYSNKNRERAVKYAGIFMNEDADVKCFDQKQKIFKSPLLGSMGTGSDRFTGEPVRHAWLFNIYGLPFQDIHGCTSPEDLKKDEVVELMGKAHKERYSKGDVAVNLASTSMITNAFLLMGDKKYSQWVLEYVDAWIKRTRDNNGIIPDNVGLSGKVGEYLDGKWYGGYYGWVWPHGISTFGQAVVAAAENALLLSQNTVYIDFPRSQIEQLINKGIIKNGKLYVPHKFGDKGWYGYSEFKEEDVLKDKKGNVLWQDGWFEFKPLRPSCLGTHIWFMSLIDKDLENCKKIKNINRDAKFELIANFKNQGGDESEWLEFLEGKRQGYPVEILKHNIRQVYERMAFISQDNQDPKTYLDDYLQIRNPVTLEGLLQLTMGAPLNIYNGGLLMSAQVRFFDWANKRPGLPEDVAALVEKIDSKGIMLSIVNLSATSERKIIIQAGAYGEHRFTKVIYMDRDDLERTGTEKWYSAEHLLNFINEIGKKDKKKQINLEINNNRFKVVLLPGTEIYFNINMERYVNTPSYNFPWHEE